MIEPENEPHKFTGDMALLAETCGVKIAKRLVDVLPGIEVKVPKEYSEASILAQLDRETADIIIDYCPGSILYVPTGKASVKTRPAAHKMRAEGRTNCEIALALEVTERHVRALLQYAPRLPKKADPRQIDMFSSPSD